MGMRVRTIFELMVGLGWMGKKRGRPSKVRWQWRKKTLAWISQYSIAFFLILDPIPDTENALDRQCRQIRASVP